MKKLNEKEALCKSRHVEFIFLNERVNVSQNVLGEDGTFEVHWDREGGATQRRW